MTNGKADRADGDSRMGLRAKRRQNASGGRWLSCCQLYLKSYDLSISFDGSRTKEFLTCKFISAHRR